jgi:hypothetical protein
VRLTTYEQFLDRVEEYGLLAFHSRFLPGFPHLGALTEESQWHTGDPETDPWQWKDRAASEKRLAFGCILGGHKGFVSRRFYPLMVAACRPDDDLETRYRHGLVSGTLVELARLFTPGQVLSTADVRAKMGVHKGKGVAKVDNALIALQREYIVTVCGNRRKIGKDGREYGWPANTYCLVEDWAGDLLAAPTPSKPQAREQLLDMAADIPGDFELDKLEIALFGRG